jgi:hypothetical protein
VIKNVIGALPQALEIIFEAQRKRTNEKKKKKKLSELQNAIFFLLFGPPLLSNLITFLFLIQFK